MELYKDLQHGRKKSTEAVTQGSSIACQEHRLRVPLAMILSTAYVTGMAADPAFAREASARNIEQHVYTIPTLCNTQPLYERRILL